MIHELNVNQSHYQTSLQRLIHLYDRAASNVQPPPPPIGLGRRGTPITPITRFFESVVVRPSEQQITNSCEECLAQQSDTALYCPITLDSFQLGESMLKIRHCGHTFKKNALLNWFQRNVRCPICRYDIRDYRSSSTPSSSSTAVPSSSTPSSSAAVPSSLQDVDMLRGVINLMDTEGASDQLRNLLGRAIEITLRTTIDDNTEDEEDT